ncbi:MAG: vitamin B12-dependent ribonucleotide reductase [Candidatus Nomurabacteria bacterium]|jgi:ribonucleoside-diphosphate reductase alpha chain|nr:vitamin B12-dependent ribonucleotide reductase [Candidatus Nomurabacteria bacterium]
MAQRGKLLGARQTSSGKLQFGYMFSKAGVDPYDEVTWEKRDVVMTNWRDGSISFEQKGVEFPDFWSLNATQIVTSKYFRGKLGTDKREHSLKQLIDRVANKYVAQGKKDGYFATPKDAEIFAQELKWMLLHQVFSFNSPVWFNVGTDAPQQVSACFILGVEDDMEAILNWYVEEGKIFKRGSGAGVNLSRIRGAKEGLSSGGRASGPVSFMRGADSSAGTIASGGATRRAAKMVVLDIDHPDIEAFIDTKVREEEKIRVLRDAGFDMDVDGRDTYSVQYQNANNSVRVSDEFMRAVEVGAPFGLRARRGGSVIETVDARELFKKMSQAAWACADPGIQYDDTINSWHTIPNDGKITASNPCSEYMSIDNSSCNLASINLLKFLDDDSKFDVDKFIAAIEVIFTAMDLSVTFGDFPTENITANTRKFRQLGIGYANLGALLMAIGLPYDSPEGQNVAAAITSLMTAAAYRRSAEIAAAAGPYDGYAKNVAPHTAVMRQHAAASMAKTDDIVDNDFNTNAEDIIFAANREWEHGIKLGAEHGWRNSQASLLAPTGTIGFMMDCDTTGIEPDFSLVKFKKLVGGGSMQIVNQTISRALATLGYDDSQTKKIVNYISRNGNVVGAPELKLEHYTVFDCAVGDRAIEPMGHLRMMAAVQPFLSGAISKTVNMSESATIEDVEEIYMQGWKMGLKAIAIYRDNCKVGQPLSDGKKKDEKIEDDKKVEESPIEEQHAMRRRLPDIRPAQTYKFEIAGADGYLIAGSYPDNGVGEIFISVSKQGSTLAGLMDAFATAISISLQYGVPLETYVRKFINTRFDPAGMTNDPDIRFAQSPVDYIFRRLALDYLPFETRASYGIYTTEERQRAIETGEYTPAPLESDKNLSEISSSDEDGEGTLEMKIDDAPEKLEKVGDPVEVKVGTPAPHSTAELASVGESDAPICMNCGVKMRPAGSCHICELCGSTSGCS